MAPVVAPYDLAFASDGSLWLARLDGMLFRLTRGADDREPAWSPDGSALAFVRGTGAAAELYTVRGDGSDLHRLTNDQLPQRQPRWSPGGDQIAYVQGRTTGDAAELPENAEVWIVRPDGSGSAKLADGFDPAWAPDRRRLAFATNGIRRTQPPAGPSDNAIRLVDALTRGQQDVISVAGVPQNLDPGYGYPFRPATFRLRAPSWAAAGGRLAFSADGHTGLALTADERGGDPKVWLMNYEGGVGRVVAAPRGSLLTIESRPATGYARVVVVDTADGGRVEIGSERLDVSAAEPAFAPDGQRLAAITHLGTAEAPGARELLIFDQRGTPTARLAAGVLSGPTWNPAR